MPKEAEFPERLDIRLRKGTKAKIAAACEKDGLNESNWLRLAIANALRASGRKGEG
ncbi:hypothetical protein FBZ84_101161 [Azospirillum baldaniorum]|uniref:hypothetical protein n=1 Tax=Azospirillum baldaniorum TaxID=1064539 RepID=UPI0011AC540B|nr:hypothetical protein [Azospirillum baldaniorum]TWA71895.1 hypothetical protein FBZ84_101161 [Azospirillum baldaniorum]